MKKLILTLIAVSTAAISFSASAQFAKPEDAVKYRKAAFTVTAAHFGRMGAMAQGKARFDAKIAARHRGKPFQQGRRPSPPALAKVKQSAVFVEDNCFDHVVRSNDKSRHRAALPAPFAAPYTPKMPHRKSLSPSGPRSG